MPESVTGATTAGHVSRCVRLESEDPAARRIGRDIVLAGVSGFGAEVVGIALGLAGAGLGELMLIAGGLGLFLSGALLVVVESARRGRRVRRVLARRGVNLPPQSRCVAVEDAQTFSQLKTAPDDVALLHIDETAGLLRIEGLTHRYIIHRRDVTRVTVRRAPSVSCTSVGYRINGVELVLAISENTLDPLEIMKQAVGIRPRLLPIITAAIGAPVGK
jgi:hypothetical protein